MSAHALARQLFAPPGAERAHTRHLLAQAAGLHARLLNSTTVAHRGPLDGLRERVGDYLRGSASALEKRLVLDDPHLVEALHSLACVSDELTSWDATVAAGCHHAPPENEAAIGCGQLGNIVAAILLRQCRHWCGEIELATDTYGRVHFPFCDWKLVLVDHDDARHDLLAHQGLRLHLDEHEARWSFVEAARPESLVRMPRRLFDAMFVENREIVAAAGVEFCDGSMGARFERASRLAGTLIRFEPISGDAATSHADLTGGIVDALVTAIELNSPHIHAQLCQCIRTINGFELPPHASGQIASFSVPTSPGVIGFNVQYTARGEPRLDPYCFMWIGHELGHTVHYLIDDVAYLHGWRFLENPAEMTPCIPRYGRGLSIRTLFQVPYVHLFEWWLLMLFHEHGFAGLPWQIGANTFAVGEELRAEIHESFEWIDQHARLTCTGQAVVGWLRELVHEADDRWRQLSFVALAG